MPHPEDQQVPAKPAAKPAQVSVLERTDAIARLLIAEQAQKRADLTLRLRLARLAREAVGAKPAKAAPRARPKVRAAQDD